MVNIIPADERTKSLTHTVKVAAITTAEAIAANTSRRYLLLQNDDATDTIYVKVGAAAVANEGVKIAPGGSYVISAAAGNLDTGAVNLIASANTPLLLIAEGVEE
jgi:hypothetical protein